MTPQYTSTQPIPDPLLEKVHQHPGVGISLMLGLGLLLFTFLLVLMGFIFTAIST